MRRLLCLCSYVHEALFTVIEHADLVFWPIALDFKVSDVEAMPDGNIDVTLFNGLIATAKRAYGKTAS